MGQSRINKLVNFFCYAELSIYRVLIPAVGDVYRRALDANMATLLDEWGRQTLLHMAQSSSSDPPATYKAERSKLIRATVPLLLRTLPPQEQKVLPLYLHKEISSPRFLAEFKTVYNNPTVQMYATLVTGEAPEAVRAIIEKDLLKQIAEAYPLKDRPDPAQQHILDEQTGAALRAPDALVKMSKKVVDGVAPWGGPEKVIAEAFKIAKGKTRYQEDRKDSEKKQSLYPYDNIEDEFQESSKRVTMRVKFEEARLDKGMWEAAEELERVAAVHLAARQRREEVEQEIQQSFRGDKVQAFLRFYRLYCEYGGDLSQNKKNARAIEVDLRTFQNYFAEARKRGWIPPRK